jgi:histidyl-tRNA synthetase
VAGARDLAEGVAQLKDLDSGEQEPVALDRIVTTVKERLA